MQLFNWGIILKGVTGNLWYSLTENEVFKEHLRHIKRFPRCIITEFERKIDVQNHQFEWVRFENWFF